MTEPTNDDNDDETKYLTEIAKGHYEILMRRDDYTAFVTLTFRWAVTEEQAKAAANWWLRKVTRWYEKKINGVPARKAHNMSNLLPAAITTEPHKSGSFHVHMLLVAPGLDLEVAAEIWRERYGVKAAEIRAFDKARRGVSYIVKRIGRDGHMDITRELTVAEARKLA